MVYITSWFVLYSTACTTKVYISLRAFVNQETKKPETKQNDAATVTFDPERCTYRHIQLIALHFEHPCRKFMVGKDSQFTLQPMANTSHKFPMMGGGGARVFHVK